MSKIEESVEILRGESMIESLSSLKESLHKSFVMIGINNVPQGESPNNIASDIQQIIQK